MRRLVLITIGLFFMWSAGPCLAQTSATTATVQGTIKDVTGAPVAGASVQLQGASRVAPVTTDATGSFSISNVPPGLYNCIVSKAGYRSATLQLVTLAGQTQTVALTMQTATLTSLQNLQTIATVHANSRAQFNTTPASVGIVTAQTFIDQAQPQITRVVSQIPGVQISFPDSSSNAASPGSITFPTIRGASSYETASLIDGHPLAVGGFGDYVTTFLQSFLLSSVEAIKGPGADAPEVNNAIGGTLNFRTKDPTFGPTPSYIMGVDNRGGTFFNFGFSDTFLNGKLGAVFDLAATDEPGAINGQSYYFDPTSPTSGQIGSGNFLGYPFQNFTRVGQTSSFIQTTYPLLACCYQMNSYLNENGELLKLRYRVSSATTVTASYLGGQAFSDQNGNTGNLTMSTFTPGTASYNGALKPGTVVPVAFIFVGGQNLETNNEPIFQVEGTTTLGNDTAVARYYHASISRLGYEGSNPDSLQSEQVALYGTSSGNFNINQTYNGTQETVLFPNFFRQNEEDKLFGYTLQYTHPFTDRTNVSLSVDRTYTQSTDFEQFPSFYSVTIPTGSSQIFTTYLLRGHFDVSPKLKFTVSNYLNSYNSTFAYSCPFSGGFSNCNPDGSNASFQTIESWHDDPRLGVVFQPNPDVAVRFAMGSSIAPPYLALLSTITSPPTDTGNGSAIITQNSGTLKPETAWGYDLGSDVRAPYGIVVSGDLYLTNLFNRYFQATDASNFVCTVSIACFNGDGSPYTGAPEPVYVQSNQNLSNFRFEGIELAIKREPLVGLGFSLAGSLQRGYTYNLPANFYCSALVGLPCTPANYNSNLNIIANQNLNGEGIGTASSGIGANARIPYSQGNAEVSYRWRNGAYAALGSTYYGFNNSLNVPGFAIGYATLRYPLTPELSLQVSGDNIFNAYTGVLPVYGGGVAIPLANGTTAGTVLNVLGPATYRFMLTKTFGGP